MLSCLDEYSSIYFVGVFLAALNSVANPFVYAILMPSYRRSVFYTFCACLVRTKPDVTSQKYDASHTTSTAIEWGFDTGSVLNDHSTCCIILLLFYHYFVASSIRRKSNWGGFPEKKNIISFVGRKFCGCINWRIRAVSVQFRYQFGTLPLGNPSIVTEVEQ